MLIVGFPGGTVVESTRQSRRPGDSGGAGLIPGLGRSPGEGNGNPLQYSCLENSMDRGAWRAIIHGAVTEHTQHMYVESRKSHR